MLVPLLSIQAFVKNGLVMLGFRLEIDFGGFSYTFRDYS
jgi:hypothetical protein